MSKPKERVYVDVGWKYVVETFEKLAIKKRHTERFRIEYYQFTFGKILLKDRLNTLATNVLGLFSEIRYIIICQLFKPVILKNDYKIVIHLSKGASFLKTIIPIAEMLIEAGETPIFLCSANHYKDLKLQVNPKIAANLEIHESVKVHNNFLSTSLYLSKAICFGLIDTLWFIFQPIRRSFSNSFSFGRHAIVHHYFDEFWKNYFKNEGKTFLAADDKYLWEMMMFCSMRQTPSLSAVFQHGKMSDLYYPMPAKKFCAWGQADYEKMINRFQADKNELICIGSPYFDSLYNEIKKADPIPKDKRSIICFFGQNYPYIITTAPDYYKALNWFYKLSEEQHFYHKFSIKPHPFDKDFYYDSKPEGIGFENDTVINVLRKSLIMVNVDSTTILEAAVAMTPSIQLIAKGNTIFSDESWTKISLKAETYEEFEALVYKLYDDPEFYQKTVEESSQALHLYFNNLGHSLENIKELILGLG